MGIYAFRRPTRTAPRRSASLVAVLVAVLVAGLTALGSPPSAAAPPPSPPAAPSAASAPDDDDPLRYRDASVPGKTTTLKGDLVTVAVDRPGQPVQYTIETKQGDAVPIDFGKDLPADLVQGTITAQVTDDGEVRSATIEPAAVAAPTPAAHKAYVVKVTNRGQYVDNTGNPATDADIAAVIDLGLNRWVAESNGYIPSFEREGAFVTGQAAGTACQSGSALWDQFDNELFPNVDFGAGSGNHLIVYQPGGCGSGIGTVGSGINSGGKVSLDFNPRKNTTSVPHELGHNVSLSHAHSYYCDAGECQQVEYGNSYSAMGSSIITNPPVKPGSFDSFDRSKLGITSTCEVPSLGLAEGQRTVAASYDLFARATDVGTRGIKVVDPVTGTTYHFDWRNALGRDNEANYARTKNSPQHNWFNTGITVQKVEADGTSATVLGHPKPGGGNNFGLLVGQTYTADGVSMRVDAISAQETLDATAQVTVTLTNPSVPAGPALPAQNGTAAILGAPNVGETMGVQTTGWAAGTCFRYQWLADGQPIAGAVGPQFTVTSAQAGKAITARIIGQATGYAPTTVTASAAANPDDWADVAVVPNIAYQAVNRQSKLYAANTEGGSSRQLVQRAEDGDDSRYLVRSVGDGIYQLENVARTQCAQPENGSTADNVRVLHSSCSGTASSLRWRLQEHPSGGTAIRSLASGRCLMPRDASNASGAVLVQSRCRLAAAQGWNLSTSVPPSSEWETIDDYVTTVPYELTNVKSSLLAGIGDPASSSAQRLQQRAAGAGAQWNLVVRPGGYNLYGTNRADNRLCVEQSSGNRVGEWYCGDDNAARIWRFAENPAGGVSLINKQSGLCIGVEGASTQAGALLVTEPCSVQPHLRWNVDAKYAPVEEWQPRVIDAELPYAFTNVGSGTQAGVPAATPPSTNSTLVLGPTTGDATKFRFEPNADGTVRIRNVQSGRCADVYGSSQADNAKVATWSCGSADNQKWRPLVNPAGGTAFRNVGSGKCLTTKDSAITDGTELAQVTCAIAPVQRWNLTVALPPVDQWAAADVPLATPRMIQQVASGLPIGSKNPGMGSQTVALQDLALPSNKWTFAANPDGSYAVRNISQGWCLDVLYSSTSPGIGLFTYGCSATDPDQKWQVLQNPAGELAVRNTRSGLCLSTKAGGTTLGTTATQEVCGYDRAQRWSLVQAP